MTARYQPVFAKDAAVSFGMQLFALGVAFVTGTLIARQLAPQGNGTYSLCILIPTLTASVMSFGLNYANVYLIGKRALPPGRVIGSTAFLSLGLGLLSTLILLALIPLLNKTFLKDPSSSHLFITVPFISILLLIDIFASAFLAHRDMLKWSAAQSIRHLVYLSLLLAFFGLDRLTVGRVLMAYMGGLLATFASSLFLLQKSGRVAPLGVDGALMKEALLFGGKQHIGTISQLLNYRLDALILAALLTRADVGLYSLAVMMGETIWYIPNSIGQILYSKTASSKPLESNFITPVICRNALLLSFLAATVLWVVSGPLIPRLFTDRFTPSVAALKLLLPGVLCLSVSKVLGSDLTGRGFPQYSTYASLLSLAMNIPLNFFLIPRYGIQGASSASSITYLINALIILYFFKRTSGVPVQDVLFIKLSDMIHYREQFQRVFAGAKHA